MPVMLPPGQAVSVAVPAGQVATPPKPPAQPEPPNPFRTSHGPPLVLMPHKPDPQPQGPAQMSRRGRPIKLSIGHLASIGDWAQSLTEHSLKQPDDEAPHLVFSDMLEENGDPRFHVVRAHLQHIRDKETNPRSIHPWMGGSYTGSGGGSARSVHTTDGGWIKAFPAPFNPGMHVVRYLPHVPSWEKNQYAPDYRGYVPSTYVDDIFRHIQENGMEAPDPYDAELNRAAAQVAGIIQPPGRH